MTNPTPARDPLAPLVDRFLGWKCPPTVHPDGVDGERSGTNLLSGIEAREMLQHVLADSLVQPKITGYRQLDPSAVDLMNEAKALGAAFDSLIARLRGYHTNQKRACELRQTVEDEAERQRLLSAEPERWLAMGRTDIQTGVMKIVRSIAQPAS